MVIEKASLANNNILPNQFFKKKAEAGIHFEQTKDIQGFEYFKSLPRFLPSIKDNFDLVQQIVAKEANSLDDSLKKELKTTTDSQFVKGGNPGKEEHHQGQA